MKRMSKKIWIMVFFIVIIFTNTHSMRSIAYNNVTISTAITNISWSKTDLNNPGEGYSHFNFSIDFSIRNPTLHKVTIVTPYLCNFETNMTTDFANKSLDTYNYGRGYACAIGYIDVDPGITHKKSGYYIAINETELEILPDGIYTVWMFVFRVPTVVYNETILRIENGIVDIDYGSLPSVAVGYQKSFIMFFGCVVISTLIIIRKSKK